MEISKRAIVLNVKYEFERNIFNLHVCGIYHCRRFRFHWYGPLDIRLVLLALFRPESDKMRRLLSALS